MTSKQQNVSFHDLIAVGIYDHFHSESSGGPDLGHLLVRAQPIVTALKKNEAKLNSKEKALKELLQFLTDIYNLLESKKTFDNKRCSAITDAIDQAAKLAVTALQQAARHVESSVILPNYKNALKDTYAAKDHPRYTQRLCEQDSVETYFNHADGIHTLLTKAHEEVQAILRSDNVLDAISLGATHFSLRQFLKAFFALFTRGPSPSQEPKIPFLERCQTAHDHLAAPYGSLYHNKDALNKALQQRKEALALKEKEEMRRKETQALEEKHKIQRVAIQKLEQSIHNIISKIPVRKIVNGKPSWKVFKELSAEKFTQFQHFLKHDQAVSLSEHPSLRDLVKKVLDLNVTIPQNNKYFKEVCFDDFEVAMLRLLKKHQQTLGVSSPTTPPYTPGSRPGFA